MRNMSMKKHSKPNTATHIVKLFLIRYLGDFETHWLHWKQNLGHISLIFKENI